MRRMRKYSAHSMGLRKTESRQNAPASRESGPSGEGFKSSSEWRVLFVSSEGRIGGAERSLLLLVSHLRKRHRVSVACPGGSPLAEKLRQSGCVCHPLPPPRSSSRLSVSGMLECLKLGCRIRRIVRATRPNLVHANSIYAAGACLVGVFWTEARLIWHARDCLKCGLASRILSRFCARIIAVSSSVKKWLVVQGVNASRISVVYNGVECGRTASPDRRAAPSNVVTQGTKPSVVFANVGQFVPWKKQALFLAAAARVASEMPHAGFWLVGDDLFRRNAEYKSRLIDCAAELGITEAVKFLGWRDRMEDVWKGVDCLVHAANAEPFGRVIIEAMVAGVPVVAVDSGGPGEIIQDGATGILVAPDDAEALSGAMLRLARDSQLARRLSSAAREMVFRKFTAAHTARRVERVYATLCLRRTTKHATDENWDQLPHQ